MIFRRLSTAAAFLLTASPVPSPAWAQLGPVPLSGLSVQATGATASRPLAGKLSDQLSVLDFGAACDGVTDDSAAVAAAAASGRHVAIPDGRVCNAPGAAQPLAPFGAFTGPGKVLDASGTPRGPMASGVTANPNPASWNPATNQNDGCTASFQCWGKWDYAHVFDAEEFFIADSNGGHTLGQPAHGYQYMPGAIPHQAFFSNSSGWNQSATANDGRTGAAFNRLVAQQNGQGDMILNEGELLCAGTPTAAGGAATTDWLANPGCSWEAGDITALAPNQYLQHSEWHFNDAGYDVAAVGRAMGYSRSASFAGIGTFQGSTTAGSTVVSVPNGTLAKLAAGQSVAGAGIPAGASIASLNSQYSAVILSAAATATASNVPLRVTFTGSTTAGSASLLASSVTGLAVGQTITGPGIPAGTTVAAISGKTLTLSAAASATAGNAVFSYAQDSNNRWVNDVVTCNGSVACDAAYEVMGKWRIGLDLTEIATSIDAAVAMQAGQRIYLNGAWGDGEGNPGKTHLGADWLTYDAPSSTIQLADRGSPVLELSNPANAADFLEITGAAANGYVSLNSVGLDGAIGLLMQDKGGSGLIGVSNGALVTKQVAPANASGYLQLSPGTAGQPFSLAVLNGAATDLALAGAGGGAVHPQGAFRIDMATPASSSAPCTAGQTTFDASYQYDCVATNTWKRAALSSW